MSIFSDYECGAMSDVEYHNACVEMNARERDEEEKYLDGLYDNDREDEDDE